tara:strand:- start:538 stop:1083 length:546 start_codon:yes stop_codon:yes gene_type:complete
VKVTSGKLQKRSVEEKLRNAQGKGGKAKVRVEQLKLVEVEVLPIRRVDMNPVLVLVEPEELEGEEEQGLVANLLAMTGSQTHLTLKVVLFLQKFVRAVSHVAEMNRMSVEAVLEKRATHLVRRDSENIVCLRGGVTNSRKLATVEQTVVQGDVQVAVAVIIILLTGNIDSVVKHAITLKLF